MRRESWLHDDLLAWLSPGGLLLTATVVFVVIDVLAGHAPDWRASDVALGACALAAGVVAAAYRERRRQRTQLSLWRRVCIERGLHDAA